MKICHTVSICGILAPESLSDPLDWDVSFVAIKQAWAGMKREIKQPLLLLACSAGAGSIHSFA